MKVYHVKNAITALKYYQKKNNLGIMEASATNYQFRKEFEGVGLNRQKQITRK